jgi:hypothetical protein
LPIEPNLLAGLVNGMFNVLDIGAFGALFVLIFERGLELQK